MEVPPLAWAWKQGCLYLEFYEIFIKHVLKSPPLVLLIMRIKCCQGSPRKEGRGYCLCLASFLHRSLAGTAPTLTHLLQYHRRAVLSTLMYPEKGSWRSGHTGNLRAFQPKGFLTEGMCGEECQ